MAKRYVNGRAEMADRIRKTLEDGFRKVNAAIWRDKDTSMAVESLDQDVAFGQNVVEVLGRPTYVSDVTDYSEYRLTETGWYAFARITAQEGVLVTAETTVDGAEGYVAEVGEDHVDVAVKFDFAAQAVAVTIDWGAYEEAITFRATDMAVANLNEATGIHVPDAADVVTWTYALTEDAAFVEGKAYYTEDDGVYTLDDSWTAGDAVTANTYFERTKATFSGMEPNMVYALSDPVGCPIEIEMPAISSGGGMNIWYGLRLLYTDELTVTVTPSDQGDEILSTSGDFTLEAGINDLKIRLLEAGGVKLWRLACEHSDIE